MFSKLALCGTLADFVNCQLIMAFNETDGYFYTICQLNGSTFKGMRN